MTKEHFRRTRKALGLTQAELAKRLGVSQQWIYYLERGSREITKILEAAMRTIARDEVRVQAIAYDGTSITLNDLDPADIHWRETTTNKRIHDPFRFLLGVDSSEVPQTTEGEATQ